ncbi:MAG: hypothetical protein HQ568_06630, partial [Calditrichaeota bacterium]|nr:hypothetical protein [Calditrichota bacterium]
MIIYELKSLVSGFVRRKSYWDENHKVLFLPVLFFLSFMISSPSICQVVNSECTTAIISGDATPDGRPLLWKNRDRSSLPDQEFAYFDDGDYSYVTVISAGETDKAFGGVNSVGFAIENSNSYNIPDTIAGSDDDGYIMKLALQTCETVDDFAVILDNTNEAGRTCAANYGVIDAEGGAAIFEAASNTYVRFDATDEEDAPDGFLVRANFSYSGDNDDHSSQWRHDRAYELILDAVGEDNLTLDYFLNIVIRDLALDDLDPYPLPYEDFYEGRVWPTGYIPTNSSINRNITRSTVVVQGVLQDEDPLLSTMYAVAGQPIVTAPIPIWVHSASTPVELDGDDTAPLCDLANQFVNQIYNLFLDVDALNTFQLMDGNDGGLFTVTDPIIDTILTRTQIVMEEWRNNMPESGVMEDFQNEQATYAYDRLSNWNNITLHHVPGDYQTIQEAIDVSL